MSSLFLKQIKEIDFEDLQYIEQDFCTYELVSLGFLLYAETHCAYVLQKLLVGFNSITSAMAVAPTAVALPMKVDILTSYAKNVNPQGWRESMIEAFCIIGARRVLSKLGLQWIELKNYFLPQIKEFSIYVHPVLKALYKVCEGMTQAEAGSMILHINQEYRREGHLRFYDSQYLEIFLLDWLNERVVVLGDRQGNGINLAILLQYFKLNDLENFKNLLMDTVKMMDSTNDECTKQKCELKENEKTNQIDLSQCYMIRRESAGIVLIINQEQFETQMSPDHINEQPKSLSVRQGTRVDCNRLENVFKSRGYRPEILTNIKSLDMLYNIRETVKRCAIYDSIIVCILTHGFRGHVYGADSKPVQIEALEEAIAGETLKNKPKILIIQACQTDKKAESELGHNIVPKIELSADILKAMSVLPGHAALRHSIEGSWFIQSLCDVIEEYGDRENMVDILTMVNAEVSRKRGNKYNQIMVSQSSSSLRKKLYLPRRV